MRPLLLIALLMPALATAQTPGACTLGTAQGTLATPDLSARLFNTGALFYGNASAAAYVVPRARGTSPLYVAGLWLGGRVGGEIRTAGGTYGAPASAFTFWPGPLDAGAALPNPASCAAFDRIWLASPADVAAYEAGGVPAVDLREWPVGLGAPAVDAQGQQVAVGSRDQRIDLPGGERPVLGGGPTAFWVMNDVGNSHAFGSAPLGVEVQVTAFAPESGALALRQATVYRYRVVNRNTVPVDALHVGFYVDADMGDGGDDLVGVDTTRGMAYVYNYDNADGTGTGGSYGTPPPAVGLDLLSGLYASPPVPKTQPGDTGKPQTPAEFYNRLRGLWGDGSGVRAFGTGYRQTQGVPTRYTFSGDPVTRGFWSERNTDGGTGANFGGDRRFVASATAVTLAPGEARTVDVSFVFAQGTTHLTSVTALRRASDQIQAAYDAGGLFAGQFPQGTVAAPALLAPAEGASFYEVPVTFSWAPVPDADRYILELSPTADFAELDAEPITGTSVEIALARFPVNRTAPYFWRVRSERDGLDGPPSPTRSFRPYRYAGAPLMLASGARAYVESVAPGGAPACSGPGDPDEGCAEVGGDLVYESANSTGAYRLVNILFDPDSPAAFAPNDFEIRFTTRGSYAFVSTGSATTAIRLFRVPFELWDIGVVPPGSTNNPADDRQLVPRFGTLNGIGTPCAFDFSVRTVGIDSLTTRFLAAYYPVGNDYAAYEAQAQAAVAGSPAGCRETPPASVLARVDVPRGRPLYGFAFERGAARSVSELAGTTVRLYTVDRAVASEAAPGAAPALRLGVPFPNPTRGALTVALALPEPGRLRLVDVLGRTVLDEPLGAGTREVRLDTRRLASGVYAVVLEAGTSRASRTVTVVR